MYQNNLKHIGNIAVIRAMKYFAEQGYSILIPMGDYQKYDLVTEKEGKFWRIQCKATNRTTVSLASSGHYGGRYKDSALDPTEIDFLWISYKEKDYLIPITELAVRKRIGITKKHNKYLLAQITL